jgi:hypothetical protein
MKSIYVIVAVITILLVLSNLMCGFWIKSHGPVDASSISFHMNLGVATSIFALVTSVLLIVLLKKV